MAKLPEGFEVVENPQQALALAAAGLPAGFGVIQPQQERGIGEKALGALDVAGSAISGAVAEPIAGLAGIAGAVLPGEEGQGAEWVSATREALTREPATEVGSEYQQALGETLAPVGEAYQAVEKGLGDAVFNATGSPALAAGATAIPTAVLETLGVKGLRGIKPRAGAAVSGNVDKVLSEAAPSLRELKSKSRDMYSQIDDMGVRVRSRAYDSFVDKVISKAEKEGIDRDLHPKSTAALRRLREAQGADKTLTEVDTLRKIAADAAKSIDPSDARLGSIIVNQIDEGLDSLSNQIGGQFKGARQLWGRAKKSEVISDMIESASHTASGLENGLRIEARKILKNKKKRRGFTKDELQALRDVEQGTGGVNAAKFLGKFGISEGQATSMLGASIGAGGGGALGMAFGGPAGAAIGAVGLPAIGQIAKNTAQRITLNNAKFADDLVRAGSNGREIVKAYLKNTPKSKRSIEDVTNLLSDPNVNVSDIPKTGWADKKIVDAIYYAGAVQDKIKGAGLASGMAAPTAIDREETIN